MTTYFWFHETPIFHKFVAEIFVEKSLQSIPVEKERFQLLPSLELLQLMRVFLREITNRFTICRVVDMRSADVPLQIIMSLCDMSLISPEKLASFSVAFRIARVTTYSQVNKTLLFTVISRFISSFASMHSIQLHL